MSGTHKNNFDLFSYLGSPPPSQSLRLSLIPSSYLRFFFPSFILRSVSPSPPLSPLSFIFPSPSASFLPLSISLFSVSPTVFLNGAGVMSSGSQVLKICFRHVFLSVLKLLNSAITRSSAPRSVLPSSTMVCERPRSRGQSARRAQLGV